MDAPTASRRQSILQRIAAAARSCGRDPADITLTAVSKQQDWSRIAPVLGEGQTVFGENRVQDAIARWQGRREGLELRLIGPLQTNKAREAVGFFQVIESLDRPRLAKVLAEEIQRVGAAPRLYVQVNTGEEPQKAGVAPQDVEPALRAVFDGVPAAAHSTENMYCWVAVNSAPPNRFGQLGAIQPRS